MGNLFLPITVNTESMMNKHQTFYYTGDTGDIPAMMGQWDVP
jgi:hypothetical protein